MTSRQKIDQGIKLLVSRYRKQFRIQENTGFYSKDDFEAAEKKFIRFAIRSGWQMKTDPGCSATKAAETGEEENQEPIKD